MCLTITYVPPLKVFFFLTILNNYMNETICEEHD